MSYQGYFTQEELVKMVERDFPFIDRPGIDELFAVSEDDLLRRIIQRNIFSYTDPHIPYEGVMEIYDEFSSITSKAVQWLLPSILRLIVYGTDKSENLPSSLVWYFEKAIYSDSASPYDFCWLSAEQIKTLYNVFEHISEAYDEAVSLAQGNLVEYKRT